MINKLFRLASLIVFFGIMGAMILSDYQPNRFMVIMAFGILGLNEIIYLQRGE